MPDLDKAAGVIDALDAYAAEVMDENRIWLAKIIVQELHARGLLLPEGFVAVPREVRESDTPRATTVANPDATITQFIQAQETQG